MAVVTAVRAVTPERVAVDLDGSRWRTIPAEVALRVGLAAGVELGRAELRALGRELRRASALDEATRALARRDHSARRIAERLERRGAARRERELVVASLERAGILDDSRLARSRAAQLAARELGDEAIIADLLRQGIDEALAREVVATLPREAERAAAVAARRGATAKTARYLARRGFAPDSVEEAVAAGAAEE